MDLWEYLPESEKTKKSTDWKWEFKDYPKSNGIKVFSCFAGGGAVQWAIN